MAGLRDFSPAIFSSGGVLVLAISGATSVDTALCHE